MSARHGRPRHQLVGRFHDRRRLLDGQGQYSVQVFTFDQLSIDDTHSFEERIKDVAPQYMVHDRSKAFKFVFRDAKSLEIAGHPAYQATAIEEGSADVIQDGEKIASLKDGPMRILVAAKLGNTRLIDNVAV